MQIEPRKSTSTASLPTSQLVAYSKQHLKVRVANSSAPKASLYCVTAYPYRQVGMCLEQLSPLCPTMCPWECLHRESLSGLVAGRLLQSCCSQTGPEKALLLPTAVMGTKPGVVQPRSRMAARAFGRAPAYQLHVIMLALIPQEDSLCNLVSSNWLRASLLVSSGNFLDFDLAGIRSLWGETSP